jgi:hypothetical protein
VATTIVQGVHRAADLGTQQNCDDRLTDVEVRAVANAFLTAPDGSLATVAVTTAFAALDLSEPMMRAIVREECQRLQAVFERGVESQNKKIEELQEVVRNATTGRPVPDEDKMAVASPKPVPREKNVEGRSARNIAVGENVVLMEGILGLLLFSLGFWLARVWYH